MIVASGFAPESGDICLADGCYTLDMVDSWGDGWNGASFVIDGQSFGLPSEQMLLLNLLLVQVSVLLTDVLIQLQITTIQQPTQMTVHVLMHVLEHLQHLTTQRLLGELSNRLQ